MKTNPIKKRIKYIPTITFNRYVYLVIIIFFILLIGWIKWQKYGGIKIGTSMVMMENFDKEVELSVEERLKYEAEVQKYDDLIKNFESTHGKNIGNWTKTELVRFLEKAKNLHLLGKNTQAIKTLYSALSYYPENIEILENLAQYYIDGKGYQQALTTYKKIIEKNPEKEKEYIKPMIEIYIGLENPDKAGKLYIEYIKNGGTKDLELINKIRALRGMAPMKE